MTKIYIYTLHIRCLKALPISSLCMSPSDKRLKLAGIFPRYDLFVLTMRQQHPACDCWLWAIDYCSPIHQQMPLYFIVMRLTKPTLFTNLPVTCEDRDLPGKFDQAKAVKLSYVNLCLRRCASTKDLQKCFVTLLLLLWTCIYGLEGFSKPWESSASEEDGI